MPAKIVAIPDIGEVALYKRSGVRGVRLSIAHDGRVRVTLPSWAPYRLGIEFAHSKADWIKQRQIPQRAIQTGDRVGKAHRFVFELVANGPPKARLIGTDIRLQHPVTMASTDKLVQQSAEKAAIRALKKEAEQLLPQRLQTLASQNGLEYASITIKRLKSRWGSCNEQKDIVLNCYLMQLPWHLIDYVIMHELTHTKVLRHGKPFWSELNKYVRNLRDIRREMKLYQPTLVTFKPTTPENSGQAEVQEIPVLAD